MKYIKAFVGVAVSVAVIVLAICLFVYPAGMLVRLLADSHLRHAGESKLVPAWFESAAPRFSEWADGYLKTRYAASLYHDDVAATEWPMFGSVFFLVTADELHRQGKVNISHGVIREAVDKAVRVVVSPDTATWVKTKWGDSYLEAENVFYRMLLILGIATYESATGDRSYHETMMTQRTSLANELIRAPFLMRDDYPGECYPNDVLWAVAAIERAADLGSTNHAELSAGLMSVLNGTLKAPEGLPAFQVDALTGSIIQRARGCGNSGILQFAAELDPSIALSWYQAYEAGFWQDKGWAVGFTEMPRDGDSSFMDVDSGPVVWGFGSVASAFGIGAAKTVGRFDHAAPLTMEAVACAWPTPLGFLLPGIMGKLAANSWSLGEVALLFTMTRPTSVAETTPYEGSAPGIVWLLLCVYTSLGFIIIFRETRFLFRTVRTMNSRCG